MISLFSLYSGHLRKQATFRYHGHLRETHRKKGRREDILRCKESPWYRKVAQLKRQYLLSLDCYVNVKQKHHK